MNSEDVLKQSSNRARQMGVPYAGALLPSEAYLLARENPKAVLIDVRSRAELDFVGRIPGSIAIEWKSYPGMLPNPHFVEELKRQVSPDSSVMFICRSGARSHESAMAALQAGYPSVFNVLEGFEGDRDNQGHRNTVGGWRAAGLPWVQS